MQLIDLEPSPDDSTSTVQRSQFSASCTCPLVAAAGFRFDELDASLGVAREAAAIAGFERIEQYRNTTAGIRAEWGHRHLQIDLTQQADRTRVVVTLYDQVA